MLDPIRIWKSSQLPTLPGVAAKLLELIKDPDTELRQIIDVIRSDPAISAKILKSANSSFFGVSCEVRTIDRAVPLLGTTVSTSLALSFSLADDAMSCGPVAAYYQSYWRQSIVQACAAELLARRIDPALAGEFFFCGLLLDLGRLAMLKTIPRQYVPLLQSDLAKRKPLVDCELELLGFSHVEIGAKLLEHWKLPQLMIQAGQFHHTQLTGLAALRDQPNFQHISAMVVAATVGDYVCTPFKGQSLERLRLLTHELCAMSQAELDEFLRQTDERVKQAGDFFRVDMTELGSPADLMLEANEQLAQLTLKAHLASAQAAVRQQSVEAEMRILETKNVELQQQALHDPLTKLYNRHFFDETLAKEFNRCVRTASPVGVIFADVDHFKRLNDTHGHPAGDAVLRRIAQLFCETVRNSDTVARYGGEEFVILASQPTERGLEKLAQRIRQRIAAETFEFDGVRVKATVSLGAAIIIPGRHAHDTHQELIAAADACLYKSKNAGRNHVTVSSLIGEEDRRLLTLVSQLRFSRWLVSHNYLEIPAVSQALVDCPPQTQRFGELAVLQGLLTPEQVSYVLGEQHASTSRFGEIACRKGWLSERQMSRLLAWQQEDPKQLAGVLIRLGMLAPDKAAAALESYLKDVAVDREELVEA